MRRALTTVDHLRDNYGEASVALGTAMKGSWREKTHENPANLPGRRGKKQ